jgi:hypothetical protein
LISLGLGLGQRRVRGVAGAAATAVCAGTMIAVTGARVLPVVVAIAVVIAVVITVGLIWMSNVMEPFATGGMIAGERGWDREGKSKQEEG